MEYIIASLVAILIATLIVYKLANTIFGVDLRLRPLLLCAACAMFISLVLPKIVVGFAGLPGTLAVLAIFAVTFAYFVAKYEDEPPVDEIESACCLPVSQTESDTAEPTELTGSLSNEISNNKKEENNRIAEQYDEYGSNSEPTVHALLLSDVDDYLAPDDVSIDTSHDEDSKYITDPPVAIAVETPLINNEQIRVIEYNSPKEIDDVQLSLESNTLVPATCNVNIPEEQSPNQLIENQDVADPGEWLTECVEELETVTCDQNTEAEEPLLKTPSEEFIENEVEVLQEPHSETNDDDYLAPDDVPTGIAHDENSEYITDPPVIISAETLHSSKEIDDVQFQLESLEANSLVPATCNVNIPEEQSPNQLIENQDVADPGEWLTECIEEPETVTCDQNTEVEEPLHKTPSEEFIENEEEVLQELHSETMGQEEFIQEVPQLTLEQSGVTVQEAENLIMPYDETVMELTHPASEQLDDLVDFAFLSKERHSYEVALTAFKQAFALYPHSEAAPFLVVEVGNLLKNKGAYDEAIKVFSDGRILCQGREDEMMEQEFISTIAYLRIIKNILLQHRLGCIRFLEIPQHILEEIDEEFREWRNVGNI